MTNGMPASGRITNSQITMGRFLHPAPDPGGQVAARFAPQHYEPGYGYPLIVWLPGPGGDERQLRRVMPSISLRNYIGASPRLPRWPETRHPANDDWRDQVESAVDAAIATTRQRFHVRGDRVFLMGCLEAGTLALELALAEPHRYAGVISFGGPFPTGPRVLGQLDQARQLPVMLAVAVDSEPYPQADVCRDLRLFHAAGLTVALRQYPGSDALTTTMLEDANRWMMETVTGAKLIS